MTDGTVLLVTCSETGSVFCDSKTSKPYGLNGGEFFNLSVPQGGLNTLLLEATLDFFLAKGMNLNRIVLAANISPNDDPKELLGGSLAIVRERFSNAEITLHRQEQTLDPKSRKVSIECMDRRLCPIYAQKRAKLGFADHETRIVRIPGGGANPYWTKHYIRYLHSESIEPTDVLLLGHEDCAAGAVCQHMLISGGITEGVFPGIRVRSRFFVQEPDGSWGFEKIEMPPPLNLRKLPSHFPIAVGQANADANF